MAKLSIYFWQRIVTPHMVGLAVALARQGCDVTYAAEQLMSDERSNQGWVSPDTENVRLEMISTEPDVNKLIAATPKYAIHICQGIRANGLVGVAQAALTSRGSSYWVIMETVRDSGWRGVGKRIEYARLFSQRRVGIEGVLAIGHRTSQWLIRRGVPEGNIFPFAYFLDKGDQSPTIFRSNDLFRFVFVGRFIPLKRLDWLIVALGQLFQYEFELVIIGSGPLENALRTRAKEVLGKKVTWIGKRPSTEVRSYLVKCDCLVLPSLYDGWGAVVSEALMCGTPVICSDTCGSAGIVKKSNVGGVFNANSYSELKTALNAALENGCVSCEQRSETVVWSDAITAKVGAEYLLKIFEHSKGHGHIPLVPWSTAR